MTFYPYYPYPMYAASAYNIPVNNVALANFYNTSLNQMNDYPYNWSWGHYRPWSYGHYRPWSYGHHRPWGHCRPWTC